MSVKIRNEKYGNTAIITMNSPETLNILNTTFMEELLDCINQVSSDKDVYVAIITGAGKAFCAGADIKEMQPLSPVEMLSWAQLGSSINTAIETAPIPFIAAVNGYAFGGGCELALACDIRIASKTAKFALPETTLGVICGAGGTQRLPRIIGEGRAKELIYTGASIDADEALNIGLVNHIYCAEELLGRTIALADKIVNNSPIAVQQAKRSITCGMNCDITRGLEYERQAFALCSATKDKDIGMLSFINKSADKKFIGK